MLHEEAVRPATLELLKELQGKPQLSGFFLVGGTALSLQIGHRMSDDLDLFTQNDFELEMILNLLESVFGFQLVYSARNTLRGVIKGIKVDLMSHKYPLVLPIIEDQKISMFSLEDIAAMKLNAIAGDGTRLKDFIDIYFILNKLSVDDLLYCYEKKYSQRNLLHILKSLTYFDDVDTMVWPTMLIEKELTFKKLAEVISGKVIGFSRQKIL